MRSRLSLASLLPAARGLIALAIAFALFAQTLVLLPRAQLPAGPAAALAELSQLPGIATGTLFLCLTGDDAGGKAPLHHHGSDCPLCQTFGHAMLALPAIGSISLRFAAVIARRLAFRPQAAPRAPPELAGRPRGPPAFV